MSKELEFRLAGSELDWPIGTAAGMTNHPDIQVVEARYKKLLDTGVSFVTLGSWVLGEARGGNGYMWNGSSWEYVGGDEYLDLEIEAGYNAKALPGPGTDIGMVQLDGFIEAANSKQKELLLNFSIGEGDPLTELRELLSLAETALKKGVLIVEITISCPNIPGAVQFYDDSSLVRRLCEMIEASADKLRNKHDEPGLYIKFGPIGSASSTIPPMVMRTRGLGGVTTSNTLPVNPIDSNHQPAVKANNGRAGMSGPVMRDFGYLQTRLWSRARKGRKRPEIISTLGVPDGYEVFRRRRIGASAVLLASVVYWPQLIGEETAADAVEKIQKQLSDIYDMYY